MPPCQIWCLWALRKRRHNAFVLSRFILWAHDQRCMWFGKRGPLKLNHNCVKFDSYKSCGMGYVIFFVTWHHVITWSKGLLTLSAGAPQPKSPLCQVWFLCVFKKWRYIVFILLRASRDQMINRTCEWWAGARLSHHPTKFCCCRPCVSRNLWIIIIEHKNF